MTDGGEHWKLATMESFSPRKRAPQISSRGGARASKDQGKQTRRIERRRFVGEDCSKNIEIAERGEFTLVGWVVRAGRAKRQAEKKPLF